jgi:hypothetical protein
MTAEKIKVLAEELVARLKDDIHKAGNREEHVRVSARANEADLLLQGINQMLDGASIIETDEDESDEHTD